MLTAYGATVVTLMMIFYALESRSRWFTFAFAIACLGSADTSKSNYHCGRISNVARFYALFHRIAMNPAPISC